jgi:ribosomal protein S18 acetylase RimI-like enzyme
MKTLIRYATSADFHALLSIDASSFPREIAYDNVELAYLMNRPGAETLVLEEDGEIAAFLLMEVNRKRKQATLVTLDVKNEKRRNGYAAELLERSETILRDAGVARYELQVDTRNDAALSFYRKHGFQVERRLAKYYPGGRDAWQMIKKLPKSGGE